MQSVKLDLEKMGHHSIMATHYNSPICLDKYNTIPISQHICCRGENTGAIYDASMKIYEVQDFIELEVGSRKYQLLEYHFHLPCEHIVCNEHNPAEIHYVFLEEDEVGKFRRGNISPDVCGCCDTSDLAGNILVIGRTIRHDVSEIDDLEKFPVRFPKKYFMYDGTLTTGDFAPVRWLVGRDPIYMNVLDVAPVAKHARATQNEDGRIILYVRSN